MRNKKIKIVYAFFLLAVLALNLFLTLQSQEGTVRLSEGVRHWVERIGYYSDYHSFRSNAHIIIFFVVGIALGLFGNQAKWKTWQIIIIGCCIGLLDESLKVFLPTREFDLIDLVKDCIGIIAATGLLAILSRKTD